LNSDGSLDNTFDPLAGIEVDEDVSMINSIAIQPDNNSIIVGNFVRYNKVGRNRIARVLGGPLNPTSINAIADKNSEFEVYPNPSDGEFNLHLKSNAFLSSHVSLYDVLGKLVLEQTIDNIDTNFNIKDQSPGVYFLKIDNQTTSKTVKLINR
jgi:hypothetical protein